MTTREIEFDPDKEEQNWKELDFTPIARHH
jgi:hypothetical protein